MYPLKQNTALTVPVFAHDVNGDAVTGILDGSWTKRISKNGGAFAAMTVTITEMESGFYSLPLSSSHTDTEGVLTVRLTATGAKQINLQWKVGVNEANLVQIDGLATSGNNATLNLKQLNISNSAGSAIVATSTGSNGHGIVATGQGTGHGISGAGGSSNGNGAKLLAGGSAAGLLAQGAGANGHGINGVAGAANAQGARFEGAGTGPGIFAIGGSSAGAHGVEFRGGSGGGFGLLVTGVGDNAGLRAVGGTGGASGFGVSIAAGSGSTTDGLRIQGDTGGYGALIIGGATGHGAEFRGGSASGSGCRMVAATLGEGLVCSAIGGTNAGIQANGGGNGAGLEVTGAGTGAGFRVAGGINGPGMLAVGGATTGAGFQASVTAGQIEFDVDISSFAAGAITNSAFAAGAINATVIADGSIDAATFAAGAIDAAAIANGAIDAATFAAGAIDAAALAADAGTEIGTAVWASATRTLTAFSFSVTVGTNNDKSGYSLSATGLDLVLIDGRDLPNALEIIAATTSGRVSGAGTGTETFKGLDETTTRVVSTVDANGNRTDLVYT